jgi:hypothetical protein
MRDSCGIRDELTPPIGRQYGDSLHLLQQFQPLALSGRRCLPPWGHRIFISTKSKLSSGKSNLYR